MEFGRFRHKTGEMREYYGTLSTDKDRSFVNIIEKFNFEEDLKYQYTGKQYELDELEFLPPIHPTKIVAVGLNYKDHAAEMQKKLPDEPLLFMKPTSSIIPHLGTIVRPEVSKKVDYESELAVVIRKTAKNVKKEAAADYIFGYTCLNDVTARDLQAKDIQYTRSKSFDTFAPIGPYIETEIENPSNLEIKGYLNGELKQSSNTSNLIFNPYELIEFISGIMTLFPGDIISTGTPSGVGSLNKGDIFEIEIENIGKLKNFVE
ncbi:MAG: fumarylacetoacetate hydrolase family protein [Deltaproteobacteria bacterium]|jgi:2-keto-4-pentenoate hydratase/2-oxohepta-3-ene-1,7-dioic acid hydratase in catechol pathway|nr:fumarylacetoacetate hydrolase family protein [Deltaproteobacteria bacterium]MDA8299010.1 fumarylacetoacetate hydrolase family protein [Deltaproteobacteria bacterium]